MKCFFSRIMCKLAPLCCQKLQICIIFRHWDVLSAITKINLFHVELEGTQSLDAYECKECEYPNTGGRGLTRHKICRLNIESKSQLSESFYIVTQSFKHRSAILRRTKMTDKMIHITKKRKSEIS